MKITCQSCQARYTIADEKVLGKIVKIRCKKCGATIIVNGSDPDATQIQAVPPNAAISNSQLLDYSAEGSITENPSPAADAWTIHVAEGDQRQMTVAEVATAYRAGVVQRDTYCWRDGMADWLSLQDIQVLAQACGLHSASVSAGSGPSAYTTGSTHSASLQTETTPVAARRANQPRNTGEIFGANRNPRDADVSTSAPEQHAVAASPETPKLTGQRNESSVLFSLNALTQSAAKANEETPPPVADGSGLIDIRALSAAVRPSADAKPKHVDDIMNLSGGGAFGAALVAPVLAPPVGALGETNLVPEASSNLGKKPWLLFLFAAVAIVSLIVAVVALMSSGNRGDKPDLASTERVGTTVETTPSAAAAPASAAQAPAATASTSQAPTPAVPGQQAAAPRAGGGSVAPRRSGGGEPAAAPAPPAEAPSPPPAAPAGGGLSLQQAMAKAAGVSSQGGAAGGNTAAAGTSAPFDRGAAASALSGIDVSSCKRADGPTGTGHVTVTFAPNGTVSTAQVDRPPFEGTSVGSCVAGKFRGARIPAFSGSPVPVGKSFVIN